MSPCAGRDVSTLADAGSPPLSASIVVVTKDRPEDLRRALASAAAQNPPAQILVIDDGSSCDLDAIMTTCPAAIFHRRDASAGCVARRNEAAELATGDILVSIDDDAAFSAPDIVAATLRLFDDPRVGAVAIPHRDMRRRSETTPVSPPDELQATATFVGCAYAVRRDLFRQLGGFRDDIVMQGEESDFAIRLLDAGHFVVLGRGAPVLHYESPQRDLRRMDYFGARNTIFFLYRNLPFDRFALRIAPTLIRLAAWTFDPPRLRHRLRALFDALKSLPSLPRAPVRRQTCRLFRRLQRGGAMPLSEAACRLAARKPS